MTCHFTGAEIQTCETSSFLVSVSLREIVRKLISQRPGHFQEKHT